MRDSMHKKMTVYMDAEEAPVLSGDSKRDLKHIAYTDQKGVYKFEVLNLDRQKSETLSVRISRNISRRRSASFMSLLKGKRTKF